MIVIILMMGRDWGTQWYKDSVVWGRSGARILLTGHRKIAYTTIYILTVDRGSKRCRVGRRKRGRKTRKKGLTHNPLIIFT